MAVVGPPIERMLRTVYDRDESFQLLLTFALVLMFQDVFRFFWGANPRSLDNASARLRQDQRRRFQRAGLQLAGDRGGDRDRGGPIGLFLQRTNYGRLLRATAENRDHGGGSRRQRARHLCRGVHARHAARHRRRRAGRADGGRLARHGGGVRHRGVRRGGDRRARLDARRAGGRAHRRPDPRLAARVLPRVRDAGDLPDRDRRAAVATCRPVRKARWHEARRRFVAVAGVGGAWRWCRWRFALLRQR